MIQLTRTDSDNPDFRQLVASLDATLAEMDGEDHTFYSQFNKISKIKHAVVAYDGANPFGCGAIKGVDLGVMEVKRMYVNPGRRGQGIATKILAELEKWALELGNIKCILETGKRQPEAIRLYERNGYQLIPNYGQYIGVENSICFEKPLIK